MTNSEDLQTRWAQFSAATAKANSLNKATVFGALSAVGITHVTVSFDGEGDSGQIENLEAACGDRIVDFPSMPVSLYRAQSGREELTTHEMPLGEAVEELCYGYLEQEHGGWENNDGAFGEFSFHVAERRIALDFNARFTDCTHHSTTF
jgi:hypothetical protein